jgi:dihydrofolate reductase
VAAGQVPATSDLELRWTRRLMSMHRYVVSNSLSHTVDGVRVISGDIAAEIKQIKEQDGGDLLLMCGPALFAELTRQQLIDQYMLYVCPNAIGQGNHLFRDISGPVKLAFDHTVPFSTGVNLHYYRPVSISA